MSDLSFPVSDYRHIIQACKADEALDPSDPRYFNLTELRKGSSVVDELASTLEQELEQGAFHRCILSGHRGSGKSTELLQLKDWADDSGFRCLHIEVDTYLGNTQLEFSDLYLLAAQSIVRQMEALKMPIQPSKIERVIGWFAEVTKQDITSVKSELSLQTEAEIGGGIPLLGKLIARFAAGIAANSEHQLEVRRTFRQAPDQLIDYANDLINAANEQLRTASDKNLQHPNGLLLIFDNLDRYPMDAIESLLTQGSTLMRHLKCHAIYTIPVELRCHASNVYWDQYSADVILPMPALRRWDSLWGKTVAETEFDERAVQSMRELLGKRLNIDALFEHPEDATLLVKMSGGCVRDLMHMVSSARVRSGRVMQTTDSQNAPKITSSGVQRAIRETRENRTEGLIEADYERLFSIAQRLPEAQHVDDEALKFLSKRRVLQYTDESKRWLDVHPLVIETEGFKRMCVQPNGEIHEPSHSQS